MHEAFDSDKQPTQGKKTIDIDRTLKTKNFHRELEINMNLIN